MKGINITDLVEGISSWAELEACIAALPSEQERGETFEQFCKAFFVLDPVFQFEKVYRHNEIPPSLRNRLGYPGVQDLGIDGLAVTTDGKLFAYQAKFRKDPDNTPTLRELATFFTMSDKADWRITITNAKKLPSAINDRTRNSRVLIDRLDGLTHDFFERLRAYMKERSVPPQEKKTPNKTQQEAIDSALNYFRDNKRGQLILPCGTGKTLVSMWIAEQLRGRRILVMVPSLALMSQSLREWAANTSISPFNYLCLCSDTTVDLANDSPVEHLYEMDIPVTTDAETVADFLRKTSSDTSILFSTYQSSKVLSDASARANVSFNIGIFDEAHRTTGTKAGVWNIALDDKKVPIEKRLFMTATPRIYAPHITKKAKEDDVLICSMDDKAVYGKPFYEMTFGEAIARGHITDYKIVVICVTDSEVREVIRKGGRVVTDDGHEWDAKALAKRIALVKGINAYGLKKIFTFHSRVKGARAFTDTKIPYGIHQIFNMLSPDTKNDVTGFFHVNGTMSTGERNGYMREFKKAELGIMSNARCLNEGVDVPAVDTVAFIDPKKSLIDIVQATGRAMRNAAWKKTGYVFIPVVIEDSPDPEKFIESSDFDAVWQVLQAMMDQDQRLEDIVSNLRVMQGKGEEGTQAWKDTMAEYGEKVEVYNLPTRINQTRFINTLQTKTLEVIGKKWDFWYGLTVKYKEEFGHSNVPRSGDSARLGSWLSWQRQYKKQGKLNSDQERRLNEVGIRWDVNDASWEEQFEELLQYKKLYGNCDVPRNKETTRQLGKWVSHQRTAKKIGKLSLDHERLLNDAGFRWKADNIVSWEDRFEELLQYKKLHNDCDVPLQWTENKKLANWVRTQRSLKKKGKLSLDHERLLNEVGFTWGKAVNIVSWEDRFEELLQYKMLYGNCDVPVVFPDNRELGNWVHSQRKLKKKGKIDSERERLLSDAGFKWQHFDITSWEDRFEELLQYKKLYGNCDVSKQWAENRQLANWVSRQRQYKKQAKIDSDREHRLNEVGFKWEADNIVSWEYRFEELLQYKKLHNDCDVPLQWTENKQLGTWVNWQRHLKKRGKLNSNHERLLNEVGFRWDYLEEAFEKGFQETLRYKEQKGEPNAPNSYTTPDGYKLGHWQANQKQAQQKGKLETEKAKRLEEIGFKWAMPDKTFEFWFQETLRYKKQTSDSNAPVNYITPEGYKLGSWQADQRNKYKKGKLAPESIKRLEEIGFKWVLLEDTFEKWFQRTLRYKEQSGDANAHYSYTTPDGYNLGSWQSRQIKRHSMGKLDTESIKKLEEIGFKWGLKKKND